MTKRTFATDARVKRTARTTVRRDDDTQRKTQQPAETAKPCLFRLWEAERREAAS